MRTSSRWPRTQLRHLRRQGVWVICRNPESVFGDKGPLSAIFRRKPPYQNLRFGKSPLLPWFFSYIPCDPWRMQRRLILRPSSWLAARGGMWQRPHAHSRGADCSLITRGGGDPCGRSLKATDATDVCARLAFGDSLNPSSSNRSPIYGLNPWASEERRHTTAPNHQQALVYSNQGSVRRASTQDMIAAR